MSIAPEQYATTPVKDLLHAAASGKIGFDQRLIRAFADDPERSVPALVEWGLADHEDLPIDLEEDITSVLVFLKHPAALPFYIHCIRLHPEDVPEDLVMAFHTVKDQAVDPLLALYQELGEEEGGEVAFLLATLRTPDERILKVLLERLEYDAGDGALALGMYGDEAARPALEKMLAEIPAEDTHLRADIQDALDQLGRPLEPLSVDYDIRADYPEVGEPVYELLNERERIEMLESPAPEIRAGAAECFINREYSDAARKKLFHVAMNDSSAAVRSFAWQALASETENSVIRKAMFERLDSREADLEERAGALIGLAQVLGEDKKIRSYAVEFYEQKETRAAALEAMWRSLDRSFAEYFPRHLKDEDEEIVRQAIWGVGYLGIAAESEHLTRFFDNEDLRADALFAYALSARHETSRGRVHGLLRKVEEAAGGLSMREHEMVRLALDERLVMQGHKPVFFREMEEPAEPAIPEYKAGRNEPCPCGSGRKFKHCHGA